MKECGAKQQQGFPHTDPKHTGAQGPSALNPSSSASHSLSKVADRILFHILLGSYFPVPNSVAKETLKHDSVFSKHDDSCL